MSAEQNAETILGLLETIRHALHSGQISAAKVDGQRAFARLRASIHATLRAGMMVALADSDRGTHPQRFATMLRGVADRLERGELFLLSSEHDMSSDPRANQSVSFVISPVRPVDPERGTPAHLPGCRNPNCAVSGCKELQRPHDD